MGEPQGRKIVTFVGVKKILAKGYCGLAGRL